MKPSSRMMPIAMRRVFSSSRAMPWSPVSCMAPVWRSTSGSRMWLEIMIDSAIAATMIIEVALEKPPMKANSARPDWPPAIGMVSTNMSGLEPAGSAVRPYSAIGTVNRLASIR